jgi:glucan-binding YG repeat protein
MAIDSSGNIFASNWILGKVYKITESSADDIVLPETSSTTPTAVKIEGTERVGQTLEAQLLTGDGEKFTTSSAVTYDWYRLNDSNSEFSNKIRTGKTYTLTSDDLNKYIGVHATYDGNSFSNKIGKILSNSSSSNHRSSSTTSINTAATSTSDTVTNTGTTNNSNSNSNKGGWTQDTNGKWYYLKDNGDKTRGWKLVDNKWYFFDNNSGVMVTGWFKDTDGSWYFLYEGKDYGALGVMETGWKRVDSKWYYLNTNGIMASNTVVDGYTLGSDGAWIE